jgi:seryl-tRNA synthetase
MGVAALAGENALSEDQTGPVAVREDGMEKIRDLLFGEQMQRLDARISALVQEMSNQVRQLREDVVATEGRLQQALREEAEMRTGEGHALAEELRKQRTYTDQRLDDLDTEFNTHLQSLQNSLDNDVERLQREKAGREVLARTLEGMAASLRGDDGG